MTEAKEKTKKDDFQINPEEMAQAGLQFGHRTSGVHPKMSQYIYGVRTGVHVIDLEKTAEKMKECLKFIQSLVADGKVLLLVGTKVQIKDLVKKTAQECGIPYVNERWLGGTFTNFEFIKKRIEYFKELDRKEKAGELEKYTKKERSKFAKELKDLEIKIGGIKGLTKLPDVIFVLDMKKDSLAVREARAKGIGVIAVSDTNVDPNLADYVIPANDDAVSSIKYILEKMKEAMLKVKVKV
jgi:small subunit ribosomal protein S2